jgi:MoaA/NifB/PqqE/SkfB family radical SAM enzyme
VAGASTTLWLELTPRCNLSCAFCYNPWRAGPKLAHPSMLGYEQYVAAVERLVDRHRFDYVALSGGEPLLYPRLDALVGLLSSAGQRTVLTTNGRLLTRRRLDRLTTAGLGGLQVPLLAATPELHDRLSGRPSWDQAIRALAVGLEVGISTSATFIATALNLDELPRVAGLLEAIGVRDLVVNEMHPEGSARSHPELEAERSKLRGLLDQTHERAAGGSFRISFIPAETGRGPLAPAHVWERLTVTSNGELKLCNQSVLTLGSLAAVPDAALDHLLSDLTTGKAGRYRGSVDRCRCFDCLYGQAEECAPPAWPRRRLT